jgi:hypothetical protein
MIESLRGHPAIRVAAQIANHFLGITTIAHFFEQYGQ